jgi:hypothetical protein
MYSAWGDIGCCNIKYPIILHLRLLYHLWVAALDLPFPGVYTEYEKASSQAKSCVGLLAQFFFPPDVVIKDDQSPFDGIAPIKRVFLLDITPF